MKENKKEARIPVRMTIAEMADIRNRANELGISMSSFMRKAALNQKIIVKTDKEMVRQIRYIGNNINQIAHQLNMYSDVKIIEKTYKEILEYKEMLQIIIDNISKK
jgi:hypothetical protein